MIPQVCKGKERRASDVKSVRFFLFRCLVLGFVALAALVPRPAFAACSTPSGIAGDIIYNGTYSVLQYCNGTNWINAGSAGANSGTITTGDFCTATSGTVISCTTGYTGTGSVVLSASPTLTGTVTAGTFSGSGASLTSIGTSNLTAVTGTPSATTFLAGNNAWTTLSGAGGASGTGTTNYVALWTGTTSIGTSNIYQSSSNIGIGSTSPVATLDVSGNTQIENS